MNYYYFDMTTASIKINLLISYLFPNFCLLNERFPYDIGSVLNL